jgi:hypothetical protein
LNRSTWLYLRQRRQDDPYMASVIDVDTTTPAIPLAGPTSVVAALLEPGARLDGLAVRAGNALAAGGAGPADE